MPDNKTGIRVNDKMALCEYIGTITLIANFDENREFIDLDNEDFIECQLCGGNAMICHCEVFWD